MAPDDRCRRRHALSVDVAVGGDGGVDRLVAEVGLHHRQRGPSGHQPARAGVPEVMHPWPWIQARTGHSGAPDTVMKSIAATGRPARVVNRKSPE